MEAKMSAKNRRTFKKKEVVRTASSSGRKIKSLKEKLGEIYSSVDLRTLCPGHCVCCTVACPQMNYSEFMVIVDSLYHRENRNDMVEVLKKSVQYFFSNSLVKPCPLLSEKKCSVYDVRPLACRMYGLWPEDMYEERVARFVSVTGLKKEEIPLNTQCKFVTRLDPTVPITKEIIEGLFSSLDMIDKAVGGFNDQQVKKKYNQRTWHDWFMVTVFGEERLSALSSFFLAAKEEDVLDLVEKICDNIDGLGEELFDKLKKEIGDGRSTPHSNR
jgi:Fe-S-cluster containining protein